MTIVFVIIFFYIDLKVVKYTCLAVASIFFLTSIFKATLLNHLNILWYQFGIRLSKIINPLVLGIIFFFIITPTGIIGRLLGRDPLRLKKKATSSYWIERNPKGPSKESFKDQY
jgi:hypothetical protein